MGIAEYQPYPRSIESLETEEEKQIYRHILGEIKEGRYVEVGNYYLDVYLHELIEQLKRAITHSDIDSIGELSRILGFIIDHYQTTHVNSISFYYPWYMLSLLITNMPVIDALYRWLDFLSKNGWHTNVNDGVISFFIALSGISAQDYVDTRYFNVFATVDINKFLTNYGKEHYDDVLAIVHDLLNRDYQISNTNYVFKMYKFEKGQIVFGEHGGALHLRAYSMIRYRDFGKYDHQVHTITSKVPAYSTNVRDLYVKSIAREAESILKAASGIQHRWVSERVLFRQVESAFTNLKVQQHTSPSFLGRQHYDVYIPELKVALEYQGEQHFIPISFFGGEAGLIATQERDKRKKELSERNGIHQIDVLPGYNIATILKDILEHDHINKYAFDELLSNARSLHGGDTETFESRESVVSRINDDYKVNIDDDSALTELIDELIQKASKTKIGQRKLTTEATLRYQGLCSKYMRTGEHENELQVRIMMYARGIKDYSFDAYWREKKLIKMIGIENYTGN